MTKESRFCLSSKEMCGNVQFWGFCQNGFLLFLQPGGEI